VIDPSSRYDVVARVGLEDLRAKAAAPTRARKIPGDAVSHNAEAQRLAGGADDRAHRQIRATLDDHAREMHDE
jgi:hypothetical protein